jgi:hypothetical protein
MMLSDHALDALLKRLHLANTRRAWHELTRRAEQEDLSAAACSRSMGPPCGPSTSDLTTRRHLRPHVNRPEFPD